MTVQLNGETLDTQATTLAAFLVEQGYANAKIATAVNGEFIPAALRDAHPVTAGDLIEVLAPMQGG